jgi:hypothetical protein
MLFVLAWHPALVEAAKEWLAHFGEKSIANVGKESGENSQDDFEEAETGQAVNQFANRGAADKKIFAAIGTSFDEDDRFNMGDFGMGLSDLLKRCALLGAETHEPRVIGGPDAVDPAIAEGALAVKEKEEGMPPGSESVVPP